MNLTSGRTLHLVGEDFDAAARSHPRLARWRRDWTHAMATLSPADGSLPPGLRGLLAAPLWLQRLDAPDWRLRATTDTLQARADFTWADGRTGSSYELIFDSNPVDTVYLGDGSRPDWAPDVDSRGYGKLTQLAVAAANDFDVAAAVRSATAAMTVGDCDPSATSCSIVARARLRRGSSWILAYISSVSACLNQNPRCVRRRSYKNPFWDRDA